MRFLLLLFLPIVFAGEIYTATGGTLMTTGKRSTNGCATESQANCLATAQALGKTATSLGQIADPDRPAGCIVYNPDGDWPDYVQWNQYSQSTEDCTGIYQCVCAADMAYDQTEPEEPTSEEACGISIDHIELSDECAAATMTENPCGRTCGHMKMLMVVYKQMLINTEQCIQTDIDKVSSLNVDETVTYDTVNNPMGLVLECNADQYGTFIDVVETELNETWQHSNDFRQELPCTNPNTTTDTTIPDSRGTYLFNYECEDSAGNTVEKVLFQLIINCDNDCADVCGGTTTVDTCGVCGGTNECYPVITVEGGALTLEADRTGTYADPGASCAFDGDDIALTKHHNHHTSGNFTEFSESAIDMGRLGSFIVQYRCEKGGITVTKQRVVSIVDTRAPVITFHDGSFSCDDSFDDTTVNEMSCSQGDCGQCTYTCTDSSQNSANKTDTIDCQPVCCQSVTATCEACKSDQTVGEYCANNPSTQGCPTQETSQTQDSTPTPAQDSTPTPAQDSTPTPAQDSTPTPAQDSTPTPAQDSTPTPAQDSTPTPAEERICCRAMTADCLACSLGMTKERYCLLRPDTVGCTEPECPQGCSRYFDGCNQCICSNGRVKCTKMFCAEPTAFVCHDEEPDEPEHDCRTREVWSPEKREWCCVNERVGCCPQVRCRPPMDRCNRTWSQEVNDRGCLVYPCGVDRCAARPRTNPGIILRDDRGVERMRTNANSTMKTFEDEGLDTARINEDGRVTIRVRDDRGRPRVEMACRAGENACLNMTTSEDVVRRRNIIKEVVDTLGPVIMSVDESGLASLRFSRAESVVIQPVANDKPVNTTNCADADVDVQTFEEDAYEIVLREKNEQFMACTSNKLLALVTLKNINLAGRSEYSVECWHPENYKWEFVELLREGDTFTCPVLPDYTFEIASVAGLTYALTVPPTPQAEPPAPAPPAPIVVYGSGVSKIEACIEDEITVVWNGTHDLRETETADCDSNETETSPWHSEFETTGYNKTFIGLGGRYQGETRYYMCSAHCGVNNARLEVTCKYEIDPNRRVMVNTSESDLEIPALIVAGAIIIIIAAVLSAVFCKRKRVPNKNIRVSVTSKDVNDLNKRLLEKPLTWVP